MTIRTGVLQHSPLTHALASIRFAPWPMLAKKIDAIQDELRDIAPLINRFQLTQVIPDGQLLGGTSNVQEAWMLLPSDRSFGIQFSQDQLLVITDKYARYTNFAAICTRTLETLLSHMRFIDVVNMGVRYVDHIKPRSNEDISQYICERLLPPCIDGYKNDAGHIFGEFTKNNLKLRVNAVSIPGAPPVPQDLIGLLVMLRVPSQAIELQHPIKPNELLLDMDAISSPPTPERMGSLQIMDKLDKLHSLANGFFRQEEVCTDHAFKVWKGEL